jgi:two-component system OmpR family sensor kinase
MSATRSRGDRTDREILLVVCLAGIGSATLEVVHAYSLVAASGVLTLSIGLAVVLLRHRRRDATEPGRSQHELEIFSHTSHQLRSPLTIARGHAELLLQSVGGTSSEAHVEIILQELDRVVMLAERLLVLSAAEDPDFLVPIETGIDTVVIEAAQRWHAAADRRWKVDCLDEALLTADVTRLMMAIDVLVENAVAHTGAGDEIAIGGRVEDGMATFVVADTGRGMGPTDVTGLIASLRERRPGGPRRAGGTGLGLQIARAVVEAHGGWLSLASELGSGSTFALHVPLYPGGVAVHRDGYEPALRRA